MLKKALIFALVFLLSVSSVAFAYQTPEISVTDVNGDVITVSGSVKSNAAPVSLVILNPGYTKESLADGSYEAQTKAVQTFKAVYPVNGKYSIEVPMKDTTPEGEGGGTYTVYVTEGSTEYEPVSYIFYFKDIKDDVIDSLNDLDELTDEQVAGAYEKYGLKDYSLFKNGSASHVTEALELVKESIDGDKFPSDATKFDAILKEAALLAGFNASKENILTDEDGFLMYSDILGVSTTSQWNDYTTLLSEDGVEKLNKDLIKETYADLGEIQDKFLELLCFYGILDYEKGGFGHFDYFFEAYEDVYKDYGFKFSKIKSSTRNKVYKDLLSSKAKNLKELASDFNDIADEYADGSSSSSGGGGGGGGGGSVGSGLPVAPTTPADSYIKAEVTFGDISGVKWAEGAILDLANKGIVSGKAKNVFAPNDLITRSEFLKMLTLALNIPQNTSSVGFTDVDGHWAKTYILTAVNAGIASGVSESEFAPNMTLTREMGATFAYRALNAKGIASVKDSVLFADNDDISNFAVDAVYTLKAAAVISGVGDNCFNPGGNMTRAEAAKMIHSIITYAEEAGK